MDATETAHPQDGGGVAPLRGGLKAGDLLPGDFRIQRELDRGGMGVIYLADDLRHARKVAVKVLDPVVLSSTARGRFFREIRSAAALHHPNILPVHDSGEIDGVPYYITPYIDGQSLRSRLEHQARLPLSDALALTRQIAAALGCAHGHVGMDGKPAAVIHRDVKPENVLLDTRGNAYLADFGVAWVVGATRHTREGVPIGSPHYMSPEQIEGALELDARSDLYALSCVIYEMLIGEPPFTGSLSWVLAQHLTAAPPLLRPRRADIPPMVEAAVRRALAKDRADRPSSAEEFLLALGVSDLIGSSVTPSGDHTPEGGVSLAPAARAPGFRLSPDLALEHLFGGDGAAPGARAASRDKGFSEEVGAALRRLPGLPSERMESALDLAQEGKVAENARDLSRALQLYGQARERIADLVPSPLLVNLLRWIGDVNRDLGSTSEADAAYVESLRIAQLTGTVSGQAAAMNCRAVLARRRGDLDAAVGLYRSALRLATEAGEIRLVGIIEQNLGTLANIRGDLEGALVRYQAALKAYQTVGDDQACTWVLNNTGMLLNDLNLPGRAEECYVQALEIARARGDTPVQGILLTNYAEALIAMKRGGEAEAALDQAMDITRTGGAGRLADVFKFKGALERDRGAFEEAARYLGEALTLARSVDDLLVVSEVLRERGDLRLREGDVARALSDWADSLAGFEKLDAHLYANEVRARLASVQDPPTPEQRVP